jgi:hypothetical protein
MLILCSLVTWSCGEAFFKSYVEIDIKQSKSKLVVTAYWLAGSDSIAVFVSKSRNLYDNSDYSLRDTIRDSTRIDTIIGILDTVQNSKVEVYKNDQLLGVLPYSKNGFHYAIGRFKIDTMAGVRYKIKVTAPDFEPVEAEQIVQNKPKVTTSFYIKDAAILQDPNNPFVIPKKGDDFSFDILDDPNDENYYTIDRLPFISWRSSKRKFGEPTFTAYSIDPLSEYAYLQDKTFSGGTHRWRFYAYDFFDSRIASSLPMFNDTIIYTLRTVNRDMYLFQKSRNVLYEAKQNKFFAEPVILHSNIKGGYGIFSIYSNQKVVFIMK